MQHVGHIRRSADFERVLGTPPRARSAHFALHHVAERPSLPGAAARQRAATKLSTGDAPACPPPVDDAPVQGPSQCWLGTVVPKRHARRSVTRTLIKRQMRARMDEHAAQLAHGLWVVRLKAPFDAKQYPSAASEALRAAARAELHQLFARAARPPAAAGAGRAA